MKQIPLITSLIHYFKVLYSYAGKKLYVLIFLFLLGGLSEGFGISMLLPVLNVEKPEDAKGSYTQTIYHFLESSGIGVSLTSLLALLLIAFLLKGTFLFLQKWLSAYIRFNLIKNMRIGFCRKYEAMKYGYYTDVSIGYLNNIITTEIDTAVAALNRYTVVIGSIVFILIYISFAVVINYKMTLMVLVICLFMFAMLRGLSRVSRKVSILVSETNAQVQSLLIQTIYNFKYMKATDSFNHIFKQLFKKIERNYHLQFKNGILLAIPSSIIEPISVLFLTGLILYYVGYHGKSIAEIMILLLFFYKAFSRVFSFQSDWQKFNAGLGGLEVIKKASKVLSDNIEISGTCSVKSFKRAIELKDLNFSYNSKQVLFNINMVIPKNRSVGIVGESGAGKTTLFDILTALLSPRAGSICIDGIDYRELDISSLRDNIGYVMQEPVIFNDTIANNISFWECDNRDDFCKKRIKKAAELSNCVRFIEDAVNGYETIIGDKGVKLSGGQRQRIAIARELFKEPEIMIFDEATSSLDTESEALIQKSIKSMMGKRTIIIIAHRLSTIRNCDYIYVLNNGRIIEEGSFGELYSSENSLFSKMCHAQNL